MKSCDQKQGRRAGTDESEYLKKKPSRVELNTTKGGFYSGRKNLLNSDGIW